MSFGEQMRRRREELGLSRSELAQRLGVSVSAVGNYETGVSAPREEVLLRLFNALEVDPNYLYRGSYLHRPDSGSDEERRLLAKYRALPLAGRQTVHTLLDALTVMTDQVRQTAPAAEPRTIPLYTSPAAAGFAAPVFGEDYELLTVTGDVPPARSWPSASRATPCRPSSPTVRWSTSTTTRCKTAMWASSAWTAICCASSIAATPSAWSTFFPEPPPCRHGRGVPPWQRTQPHLLWPRHGPQSTPPGGPYIAKQAVRFK